MRLPLSMVALAGSVLLIGPSASVLAAEPDDGEIEIEKPAGDGGDIEIEKTPTVDPAVLKKLLGEGQELLASGKLLQAAMRFSDIVENGAAEDPTVLEANFLQAVTFYQLKLYQSALTRFEPIIQAGNTHPKYLKTLPYLLYIAREGGAESDVLYKIALYPPELYPPELADELHFLVGQHYFSEDSLGDALTRFQQVTEKHGEFFVKARYLEAVIHTVQSKLATDPENVEREKLKVAADNFKAVLRYREAHGGNAAVDKIADMTYLALGRLFFSTRQYDTALKYYDRVEHGSADWLNELFESSWVHFQVRQYPRALGNLHTLNSPYFADQYFPEARVVQALILFYNCQYEESLAVVKEFVQEYLPLMQKLKDQVSQFNDPNAFYSWLAKLAREGGDEFSEKLKRIFNAALADRKVRRKFSVVATLNNELKRIDELAAAEPQAKPMLDSVKGEVSAFRSLVVGEAGSIAQTRLQRVLKELRQHLAGAYKIRGETLKAQRGQLNDEVRGEQTAAAAARQDIVLDAEHFEWPFTGEYWKDELGAYVYDIKSACEAPAAIAPVN